MELKDYLGLTVLAAIVTTVGTLLGLLIKESLLSRSFESWKVRQSLDLVRRKYRDPIVLSALELCNRLEEVCGEYPTDFLCASLLSTFVDAGNRTSQRDVYFRAYKFQSTIYRLCAFLGWLEVYRQELVFLETHQGNRTRRVETAIRNIRGDLADGHLNEASDWNSWTDALMFREEQRAIGESMIVEGKGGRLVIGYSEFIDRLNAGTSKRNRWIDLVARFLSDPQPSKDFRLTRLQRMHVHVVELVEGLDRRRLQKHHLGARDDLASKCGL